jgi:hypothetical protein
MVSTAVEDVAVIVVVTEVVIVEALLVIPHIVVAGGAPVLSSFPSILLTLRYVGDEGVVIRYLEVS